MVGIYCSFKKRAKWFCPHSVHTRLNLGSCKGTSWTAWGFSKHQCLLFWLFIFPLNVNLVLPKRKSRIPDQKNRWLPTRDTTRLKHLFRDAETEIGQSPLLPSCRFSITVVAITCYIHPSFSFQPQKLFKWQTDLPSIKVTLCFTAAYLIMDQSLKVFQS